MQIYNKASEREFAKISGRVPVYVNFIDITGISAYRAHFRVQAALYYIIIVTPPPFEPVEVRLRRFTLANL